MELHLEKIVSAIEALTDEEKVRVLDAILTNFNHPDRDVDHFWFLEARERWISYKAGQLRTMSYEELLSKYDR